MLNRRTGPPSAVSVNDPVYGPLLADTSRTVAGAATSAPRLGDGDGAGDGDGDRDRLAEGDGLGRPFQ